MSNTSTFYFMCEGSRTQKVQHWLFASSIVSLLAFFCALPAIARDETVTKAQFLTNLALYVEWPSTVFSSGSAPFRFCTLNADDVGAALLWVNTGKSIRGRGVDVSEISSPKEAGGCQVVFIGNEGQETNAATVQELSGGHILSVSDASDFAEKGGVIGFQMVNGKIEFSINQRAAKREDLQVNPKLMQLGKVI